MRHKIVLLATALAVMLTLGASSGAVASTADGGAQAKPSGCADMKEIAAKLPPEKAKKIIAACDAKKAHKPGAHGKKDETLAGLAKRFGVSEKRLVTALVDLKLALAKNCDALTDPAVLKRFATDLGVSRAKAKAVLTAVLGGNAKTTTGKLCDLRDHTKPGHGAKPGDLHKSDKPIKKTAA